MLRISLPSQAETSTSKFPAGLPPPPRLPHNALAYFQPFSSQSSSSAPSRSSIVSHVAFCPSSEGSDLVAVARAGSVEVWGIDARGTWEGRGGGGDRWSFRLLKSYQLPISPTLASSSLKFTSVTPPPAVTALAWGSDCIFRKDVKGSSDSTTADFELSYSLVLSLSSGDILAIANNLISKPLSAHRGPVTAVAVGHEKDQEGAAVGWSVGSDLLLHSLRISSSNPTLLPAPAILSTIQLAPPMTPPILLHPLNPFECVLALSDGSTRRYNRMDSAWKSIDAAISGGATAAASSPVGSTFGELVAVCGRQGWRVSTPAEEVVAAGDEGGTCVGVTNVSGSTVVAIAVAGEVVQEDFMKWSRSPSASGAPVGGKTDAVAVYDVSSRGVQTLSLPLPARVRSLSWHTRGGALAAAAGDYIVVWKV